MSKIFGIVLIGCGHIGAAHLDDIYYRDTIKLIGVVDTDIDKAKIFARKYGAESYSTDYQQYLQNTMVDIVIIATYTASHLPILLDCLKYKKHVLCEKPIAINLSEGQSFYNAVKSNDSKVLVGHILRHNETYNTIARMIHNGSIGDLKAMRIVQNHHTLNWSRYRKLLSDCSPIIDCGVHYFDVMQWFSRARIVRVGGICSSTENDVPDSSYNYGMITAQLSDGSVGYYEVGWGNTFSSANTKEFIGNAGRIKIILQNDRMTNREEGDLIEYYNASEKTYHEINMKAKYKNCYQQLLCLINMIENNAEGTPTLDEVYSAFRIAVCADKSLIENREITIT